MILENRINSKVYFIINPKFAYYNKLKVIKLIQFSFLCNYNVKGSTLLIYKMYIYTIPFIIKFNL